MMRFSRKKDISKRRITLSRVKRQVFRHVLVVRMLIVAFIILIVGVFAYFSFGLVGSSPLGKNMGLAYDFVFTPLSKIRSINGRTNVLILDKQGSGYSTPDLIKAIIFASVDHNTHEITTITLPSDIWVDDMQAKLGSVYYWGKQKESKGGLVLAKSVVEEITGQPVQYAIVVDMNGFKSIVNELGGVEVNVKTGFTDNQYPITGQQNNDCGGDPQLKCRYETVTFKNGLQTMVGAMAFKYVNSGYAEGKQSVDSARFVRQVELLTGIKNKLLGVNVILHPSRISKFVNAWNQYVETDLNPDAEAILARRLVQAKNKLHSFNLADNFLKGTPANSQDNSSSVLLPKSGNWNDVHSWANCLLSHGSCN